MKARKGHVCFCSKFYSQYLAQPLGCVCVCVCVCVYIQLHIYMYVIYIYMYVYTYIDIFRHNIYIDIPPFI